MLPCFHLIFEMKSCFQCQIESAKTTKSMMLLRATDPDIKHTIRAVNVSRSSLYQSWPKIL